MHHQAAAKVVAYVGEPFSDGCQQYRVLLASVAIFARQDLFACVDASTETEEQAVKVLVVFRLISNTVAAEALEDSGKCGEALAAAAWTGEPEPWIANLRVLARQWEEVLGH